MSTSAIKGFTWATIDRLNDCMLMMYPVSKQAASLRPKGWRVAEYDGSRPCLPTTAIRGVAQRLANKRGAE